VAQKNDEAFDKFFQRESKPRESGKNVAPVMSLCDQIRGASLALYKHLRYGRLEKVTRTAWPIGFLKWA
jgi:hypothetical protein